MNWTIRLSWQPGIHVNYQWVARTGSTAIRMALALARRDYPALGNPDCCRLFRSTDE